MADWSELLPDLLITIAKELTFYEDLIAFGAVCTSWQSAAATLEHFNPPSRFPCLMLPDEELDDKTFRQFYLLSNGGMIRNVMLPEASKNRCLSARGGWLLTVAQDEIEAKLLHSLSRIQIDLPNLDTFPYYYDFECNNNMHFISKVVLSSPNPNSADFLVMVLWAGKHKVGFCKVGDVSWTVVEEWKSTIKDIAYHKGLLYAVTPTLEILVCNPHGSDPTKLQLVSIMPSSIISREEPRLFMRIYLLKEKEELDDDKFFIVLRELESSDSPDGVGLIHETLDFEVVEFDLNDGGKWLKVESLGNRAVFVGYNTSFSIEASADCIKPNCIYYTDDYMDVYLSTRKGGGNGMGIYDLDEETFEPFFDEERVILNSAHTMNRTQRFKEFDNVPTSP